MPGSARESPNPARPADLRARILRQAHASFFAHGYTRFTMDDLAQELGISKKTLYVHFGGKDEILAAVIDGFSAGIRADADALLRNRELNLAEKLRGFVEAMVERMAALGPQGMRELQRFAPALYQRIEDMRRKNVPYVFGRFVEEGQTSGLVRADLAPGVAIEFFLQAMQGMMHPATLERLRLSPREVIATGVELFFGGLLTPAGRKQYEKLFPR
jgi:AcrR family transcriptional regulator